MQNFSFKCKIAKASNNYIECGPYQDIECSHNFLFI